MSLELTPLFTTLAQQEGLVLLRSMEGMESVECVKVGKYTHIYALWSVFSCKTYFHSQQKRIPYSLNENNIGGEKTER